jgi:cyclophilin family peptidyl-prolyl cis-trans isomerase
VTSNEEKPGLEPDFSLSTFHFSSIQRSTMSDFIPAGYSLTPYLSEERVTQFTRAGEATEKGKSYAAVIETSKGRMVAELYADKTPITVNSFVWLARHHYFDGIVFHRVLEDFMAQTGDPTGTGRGGPGYRFEDEFDPSLRHTSKGILSMANAGPGTNGSQIFITFAPTPFLDGKHAVFGKVVEGLEVLDKIQRIDPSSFGLKPQPDVIERLYIVEK